MRESGSRNVSGTQSLFVDDLKQYQESYQVLKDVNKIIVKGNHDTGTCNGVSKCAEITFEYGKTLRGEGLPAVDEWMETMDPDENKIYKFLGVDPGMRIKMITQWYIVHE